MAQWINILRNNSFINPARLPLLCRNSIAVALVEPGLTAGWLAGWLVGWLAGWLGGWLADKIRVNFKFLKFVVDQIFELFAAFNTVTALLEQYEHI